MYYIPLHVHNDVHDAHESHDAHEYHEYHESHESKDNFIKTFMAQLLLFWPSDRGN